MADESMLALPGLQPIKYDLPFYREYLKRVKTLVKELNKQGWWKWKELTISRENLSADQIRHKIFIEETIPYTQYTNVCTWILILSCSILSVPKSAA